MKKYKTILFDLDGTLMDSSEGIFNAIRFAEKNIGLKPVDKKYLHEFIGAPALESYLTHYAINEKTAFKAVSFHRQYQLERGFEEGIVYDGIHALLGMLKESGHKLGVATLKRQDITELTLDAANLTHYFDAICGITTENILDKENIIRDTLLKIGSIPEQAIMIGDTIFDGLAAGECGLDFIAADYGFGFEDPEDIDICQPKFIAYFADDLIQFFDQQED
ncbi:MAG: HAD hydrolase-like protein [Eubacterium sp.]